MNRKLIIAIIVNIIIILSLYTLIGLINLPHKELDVTSKLRFLCFIGIHAIVFISMIVMIRLQGIYNFVMLAFLNFFIIVISITICESLVRQLESSHRYNYKKNDGSSLSIELTYLNLYFLTYMYGIIGFILTGIYLIST
jgi:hypothetical protein